MIRYMYISIQGPRYDARYNTVCDKTSNQQLTLLLINNLFPQYEFNTVTVITQHQIAIQMSFGKES